jgi:aspartate aminotransferase-like enzyme
MYENSDAKALFVVHNETSTGVTVRDLGDIAKDAAKMGILVIVDAISILGGDYLPVDKWEIDVCLGATQKCLGAPGLSLISVSPRALRMAEANKPSTTYFNIPTYVDFLREKNETPYTPALSLFYALDKALSAILEEGLKSRFKRHKLCTSALCEAIENIGLKLLADKNCRSKVEVVFRSPEGINVKELVDLMREKYGVVVNCFPPTAPAFLREVIRVGCMGEISRSIDRQMVYRTIQAISNALNDLGFKNDGVEAINTASKVLNNI